MALASVAGQSSKSGKAAQLLRVGLRVEARRHEHGDAERFAVVGVAVGQRGPEQMIGRAILDYAASAANASQ